MELASCSTVRWFVTAMVSDRISSEAVGATITPPSTWPEPLRAKIFTKPVFSERIFARGLVARSSLMMSAEYSPLWICCSVMPTAAISGRVNTALPTVRMRSGSTPSPSAWYMAMRPCIAATDASGMRSEQSPAA